MTAKRILLGMIIILMAGFFVHAQSDFSGNAEISLQFIPSNPSMTDIRLEVRAFARLDSVKTKSGANPILTSFSMPIGFDPSFVRLLSVETGQADGYSTAGLDYTTPALANGRGFVTLMNSRIGDKNPGSQVELGRLFFELKRPGTASFIAGSARTNHQGTLAAIPSDTLAPTQRVLWADSLYNVKIKAGADMPSLLCPSWFSASNIWQGIGLLNEGTEPATVQLFGWGSNGMLVQADAASNPSPFVVLPGMNQQAKLTDQVFNSPKPMIVQNGWIEVRANTPNVSGFFLQGVNTPTGDVHQMDGVPMTYTPASRLIFPLVRQSDRTTEISLTNPGSSPVDINMRVIGPAGQLLRTLSGQAPAHGTFVREISDATSDQGVYADVQAIGGKLAGIERFGTAESLAMLSGQDADLASTRLSAPHFASGRLSGSLRIDTYIALVNPSSQAATVILRLLNENGQEITSPVVYRLNGSGLLSLDGWRLFGLPDPHKTSTLTVGTVSIESNQPIIGAFGFGDPVNGRYLAALPLMSTFYANREIFFRQVAVGLAGSVDYFTGLALANPSTTDAANINIELHSADGTILAQTKTPYRLDPGRRTGRLVQELIPNFPSTQFGGYMRVTSDVEVNAFMLIGDNYYNFLSAVP
jgi:hypothetical protein